MEKSALGTEPRRNYSSIAKIGRRPKEHQSEAEAPLKTTLPATCGPRDGSRPQIVEDASSTTAAATSSARSFARASALAATSSAQTFASAAVAASVGIGILAGQARRDTHRRLLTTVISGQAARVPRRGQATHTDPHLGTGVQHRRRRRRRRRRLVSRMLAISRERPRHTAVPPLRAACG